MPKPHVLARRFGQCIVDGGGTERCRGCRPVQQDGVRIRPSGKIVTDQLRDDAEYPFNSSVERMQNGRQCRPLPGGRLAGPRVVGLGDLDGDGVPDLAVGALGDDDGGSERGAVWILFMNNDGTVREVQKISDTVGGFNGVLDNGDFFGRCVANLGDLDGDGIPDLAVGAVLDDDGGFDRGAVWVLSLDGGGGLVITAQPPCFVILPAGGGTAQFSVSASGAATYQWRKDGVPLVNGAPFAGVDTPTLTITADLFDVGIYDCVVTNTAGQATSNPAVLAVRGCFGDSDGNGVVNFADITAVLANFNLMCP